MKKWCLGVLVASIPLTTFADFVGRVVGVSDGDTITVLTQNNQSYKVRLANIDAPEMGQPFGKEAKMVLSDFIYNKPVYVKEHGKDRYDRIIGTVLKGNDNVNRLMVRYGYAWAYRQYLTDNTMISLESYAQQQKIGIWKNAENISPEQWRRMQNQK
ncbi:thermonuclease family protein [Acinetobacter lwoffii]|jgi:endonuclease YncB( thermonuclease family)|uniref:thermonuclease family protein n=1 Tax=Acinetobacter lwoffii TaxID=28090 RepID=UPI003BF6F1F8